MPETTAIAWPRTLDQPLPPQLTGSGHSWFTQYRTYPVFSAPWARGRSRVLASIALVVLLLTMLPLMAGGLEQLPVGALIQIAVQLFVPVLAGPWLGTWVRRQGWPERREGAALLGAIALLSAALLLFHQAAAEPMKQWVAERTGQVDAHGQRKRTILAIGLSVTSSEEAAAMVAGRAPEPGLVLRLVNGITAFVLTFWLAGGMAILGWRREKLGLARLARERELADAQAQRREAELRLSVLAAQVEPHFLFNTLAGVRSAIATDPARASDMIDRLVDYLRAAIPRLRSSGGSEATLGGQLDIVRAYLGLMAARMPRLGFAINAAPDLLALPCPPLMLISLAENAVKHGVEPKIGPAHIQLDVRRTADGLHITVADDGAGFGAGVGGSEGGSASGSGIGLANIRERLRQMYADRASLTLKARPEGGVVASLSLPTE